MRRLARPLALSATLPAVALLALAIPEELPAQEGSTQTGSTQNSAIVPEELREVGFDQNVGAQMPLDAEFLDADGREVTLGGVLDGKPALLALVYYECPMLCQLSLAGLAKGLKPVDLAPGEDFQVVAVSIDPGEGPELARAARDQTVSLWDRGAGPEGWHFLTGGAEPIRRLTEAAGFRYTYDEATDEWAHGAGIVILTPDGRAARYLFGVDYAPRDVRLGLVEASEGRLGTVADQVLLFCFHYDPATGKYTTAVLNLVRAGGLLTLLALVLFVGRHLRRDRVRAAHGSLGTA